MARFLLTCMCCVLLLLHVYVVFAVEYEFTTATIDQVSLLLARPKGSSNAGGLVCLDEFQTSSSVSDTMFAICRMMGYEQPRVAWSTVLLSVSQVTLTNIARIYPDMAVAQLTCRRDALSTGGDGGCVFLVPSDSEAPQCGVHQAATLDCDRPAVNWEFTVDSSHLLLARPSSSSSWSSVCDDSFTQQSADAMCYFATGGQTRKALFWASRFYLTLTTFTPEIGLDEVVCTSPPPTTATSAGGSAFTFDDNCTFVTTHDCSVAEAVMLFCSPLEGNNRNNSYNLGGPPLFPTFSSSGTVLLHPQIHAVFVHGLPAAIELSSIPRVSAQQLRDICRLIEVAGGPPQAACRGLAPSFDAFVAYQNLDCSTAASFTACGYQVLYPPQLSYRPLRISYLDSYTKDGATFSTFKVSIEPDGLVLIKSEGGDGGSASVSTICDSSANQETGAMLCRLAGYPVSNPDAVVTYASVVPPHASYNVSGVFEQILCPFTQSVYFIFSFCSYTWTVAGKSLFCVDGHNMNVWCGTESQSAASAAAFHPAFQEEAAAGAATPIQQLSSLVFRNNRISIPSIGSISNRTAAVLCKMMGFNVTAAHVDTFPFVDLGKPTQMQRPPRAFRFVDCEATGASLSLQNCTYQFVSLTSSNFRYVDATTMRCPPTAQRELQVRLENNNGNSSSGSSGFVIVTRTGADQQAHSGTICALGLTQRGAVYLCERLGFMARPSHKVRFRMAPPLFRDTHANRSIAFASFDFDGTSTSWTLPGPAFRADSCLPSHAAFLDCNSTTKPNSTFPLDPEFKIDAQTGVLLTKRSDDLVEWQPALCLAHEAHSSRPSGGLLRLDQATAMALCRRINPTIPKTRLRPFSWMRGVAFKFWNSVAPVFSSARCTDDESCHFQPNLLLMGRKAVFEPAFCDQAAMMALSCLPGTDVVPLASRLLAGGELQFAPLSTAHPLAETAVRFFGNVDISDITPAAAAVACRMAGVDASDATLISVGDDPDSFVLVHNLTACNVTSSHPTPANSSSSFHRNCPGLYLNISTAAPGKSGRIVCPTTFRQPWTLDIESGTGILLATPPAAATDDLKMIPAGEVYWERQLAISQRLGDIACGGRSIVAPTIRTRDLAVCRTSCDGSVGTSSGTSSSSSISSCELTSSVCEMQTTAQNFPRVQVVRVVACRNRIATSTETAPPWQTHASSAEAPTSLPPPTTSAFVTTNGSPLDPTPAPTSSMTTTAISSAATTVPPLGASTGSSSSGAFSAIGVPVLVAVIAVISVCFCCIVLKRRSALSAGDMRISGRARRGGDATNSDDDDGDGGGHAMQTIVPLLAAVAAAPILVVPTEAVVTGLVEQPDPALLRTRQSSAAAAAAAAPVHRRIIMAADRKVDMEDAMSASANHERDASNQCAAGLSYVAPPVGLQPVALAERTVPLPVPLVPLRPEHQSPAVSPAAATASSEATRKAMMNLDDL